MAKDESGHGGQIYGQPMPTAGERGLAIAGQVVLVGLLVATLFFVSRADPRGRGSVGDEATYSLQALSLAYDLDLSFDEADHQRYVELHGEPPSALALQSRDGGGRIAFGVPYLWALLAAPFSYVWPLEGPLILNVLLLAVAAWLSGRVLETRIGAVAWWMVSALCFASVTFAYAFYALPDMALFSASACGLALVFGRDGEPAVGSLAWEEGERRGASWLRWLAAGVLLAVPLVFRPVYGVLLIAGALLVPRAQRKRATTGLLAGAVLLVALAAGGQWLSGGSWSVFTGDRRAFHQATTGYPGVDFEADEWPGPVGRRVGITEVAPGVASGTTAAAPGVKVWLWNLAYFFIGRDVGVLPYFLPLVLAVAFATPRRNRWVLPVAVGVAVLALLWLRPFNFFGGRDAVGNRFFLPLYPALWFLAGRSGWGAGRRVVGTLAVVGLAAPLMLPLWRSPGEHPVGEDGRYRYISAPAVRWLPFESTQPSVPSPVVSHRDLMVIVAQGDGGSRDGGETIYLRGRKPVELLIASREPIGRVVLEFGARAPSRLLVREGGELADTMLHNDGGIGFAVKLGRPSAEHRVVWRAASLRFYRLVLEVPTAPPFDLPFTITPGGWQAPDVGGPPDVTDL